MPDFKPALRQRLHARRIDATRHISVIDELAQHLDDRFRSLTAQGLSPAEAERNALDELDETDSLERELRRAERRKPDDAPVLGDQSRTGVMRSWGQDVRYAARTLVGNPGFTAVAAITLALGVGANTAIFSVVNAVMLRPLNYAEPARLVRIWESNPEGGWPQFAASHPNFLDWRMQQTRFKSIAAFGSVSLSMTSSQGAEIVRGVSGTVEFLPLLGITPALGRNFSADEDRPGGDPVVLLTNGFWQRRFASNPAALGQKMALNGTNYLVIGVLPTSFDWGQNVDVLVPLAPDPARNRGDHRISVIGRLKDGVTIEEAHTDLARIADALAVQFPDSNRGWTVRLASFYDWLIPEETRESLIVLLGAVGLVLLIACGNVANLLLARGAVRQQELSIRVALGAERWRIFRQLLTESLLLALVAGAAGLALGVATTRLLVAFGPESVPRLDEVSFDLNVLGFAIALSVVSAFIVGTVPAIQVSKQHPADTLRNGARGSSSGGRQRLRSVLTVAEVALSVALLIGAGLLLRSFARLQQVETGFDVAPLMTLRVSLPRTTYPTADHNRAFYDRVLADVGTQPGVAGVAISSGVPLAGGNTSTSVVLLHRQPVAGEQLSADWRLVSPGYFKTMGIPLRGRDFSAADRSDTLPVAIISEAMAARYWPNEDPIGKTVILRSFGDGPQTVIGVARDVRSFGLDTEPGPMAYGSATAYSGWNPMNLVWRASSPMGGSGPADPSSLMPAIREAVRRIDPDVPLFEVRSLPDLLSDSFGPRRFNMYLLGVFAGVALLLAAIGLFGVMAYLVAQRTREIGVRLALGANRADIFRLVLGRGVFLAVTGAVIGVVGAFWLTRVMESLLFSVSATDPGTFVAVPILLVLVAILACYVPARRAMKVDPVTALRAE